MSRFEIAAVSFACLGEEASPPALNWLAFDVNLGKMGCVGVVVNGKIGIDTPPKVL